VRRRGRHRSLFAWLGSAGLVGSTLAACLGATQIMVEGQTDVACADVRGTSFYVAAPGAPSGAGSPAAVSATCDGATGSLGSLTVVPAGDNDGAVRITLVLGVDRPSDQCSPDAPEVGCIVARRTLRYAPHRTQRVPIFLATACLGVRCAEGETCAQGACVSSACAGDACGNVDPSAPPVGGPPTRPDADAPEAGATDAAPPTDGGAAPPSGPAESGRVACPSKVAPRAECSVSAGESCCIGPQSTCTSPAGGELCPAGAGHFRCDDTSDCVGKAAVCCLRVRAATCSDRDECEASGGRVLCASSAQCLGAPCGPAPEVPAPYWLCQ
jgi:hypothetical protein